LSGRRTLVLVGLAAVVVAAVAVASCQVYTKASFDMPIGAGYHVRTYQVRTPLRIAGETAREMGPHPSRAEPPGAHLGYETWLVQAERRVVQVSAEVPRPAAVREDGRFYAYLVPDSRRLLRVVRLRDGRTLEHVVPRHAYVFWEEPDVVRLVERDPSGAITFLHEVRLEPSFLASLASG
jgi:hypothetical protein